MKNKEKPKDKIQVGKVDLNQTGFEKGAALEAFPS